MQTEAAAGATAVSHAPDWETRRAIAVVGGTALAISTVAFFRIPLLPSIGHALSLRPGLLSLVTAVFGVGRLAADMPAGRIADRLAAPRALAGGAVLVAGGSLLLAAAGSLGEALAAAALLGVGSALANTTGMMFFSRAPAVRRGRSLAVFSAALLGGQSFGPALAGGLSGLAGWRGAEAAAGIAALLLALACAGTAGGDARADRDDEPLPAADAVAPAVRAVLYSLPFVVFFGLGAMPQTIVPLIGAHAYGLSAGKIGLALGLGGIARFAGVAAGGQVSDRIGRRPALLPGLAISAAGIALLGVDDGVWLWLVAIALMSFGSYGVTVGATMLADLSGAGGVGRRLGSFRFVGDLGLILGPLSTGFLYDRVGVVAAVSLVAALLGACCLAAGLVLPETKAHV